MIVWEKILRLLRLAWLPIQNNIVFAGFMYLLGTVCVLCVTDWNKGGPAYEWWWAELLADVYAACCLLMVFPRKLRRWMRLLFSIIAYAVALADVFCFVKFGSTITPTMLLLVGETNSQETSEFFRSYLSWDVLQSAVGGVLLVALGHSVVAVMNRGARCEVRGTRMVKVRGTMYELLL